MEVNDGRLIGDYNPEAIKKRIPLSNTILIISLLSLVWIFFYKFIFLSTPAIFSGASEVGEIFYNLFLSIISSAIFYFIVVHYPAKIKRDVINRVVSKKIGKLYLDYIMIKQDLYKINNLKPPQNFPDDFDEIVKLCNGILLTSKPPHIHNNPQYDPSNWFEYFEYYFALEKHNIEHLNRYWEEIPSEVKVLIDALETSTLISGIEMYKKTAYSDKLSDLGGPIWAHLNTLRLICLTFQNKWKI